LHNVVYDLVQQILNARMDRPLNRRLCHVAFLDARLPQRVLDGQAEDNRLGCASVAGWITGRP
jgi:hypothetical protein